MNSLQLVTYPNPNKEIFDITFAETQEHFTVKTPDLLGRQFVTIDSFNTKTIAVGENLKTGVYLVEITTENTSETV